MTLKHFRDFFGELLLFYKECLDVTPGIYPALIEIKIDTQKSMVYTIHFLIDHCFIQYEWQTRKWMTVSRKLN